MLIAVHAWLFVAGAPPWCIQPGLELALSRSL